MTDGEVSNPDAIIQLIKKEQLVVHTFGIGSGCSKYLVKETAKAGRGSFSFVEESDNLKVKVINALKKASEPSLKDCQITCNLKPLVESPFGS